MTLNIIHWPQIYFGHLMQKADSLEKVLYWERLKAGGEEEDRGWDSWMVSPTRWTWVWAGRELVIEKAIATHSSTLTNPMDRGVWQAMVHRVTKSQTQLKWLQFSSIQSLSRVQLFVTPWTTAHQASLSITNSCSPPKPMSIESVMPFNNFDLAVYKCIRLF